ncbi:MAG: hypothetical protein Q7U04_16425, partial [Bacteriovorax sp.]|nr:hypothetical protein [Bacteriovorax sp.]
MNSNDILVERSNSLEKAKNKKNNLQTDEYNLKVDKVSLTFELSMLAREKKEILLQVANGTKLKFELIAKKNSLTKVLNEYKINLKIDKYQFIALGEEIESLAASINSIAHENHVL